MTSSQSFLSTLRSSCIGILPAALLAGCASTSAQTDPGAAEPMAAEEVVVVQEATGSAVEQLDDLLASLRIRGALDRDLQNTDLRLRLARKALRDGDSAYADELAQDGLGLARYVADNLEQTIQDDLDRMDLAIQNELGLARDEVNARQEKVAHYRLGQIRAMIAERNQRASSTNGRFATRDYDEQIRPLAQRVAAYLEAAEIKDFKTTKYKEKFRESLMRVRGTETKAFQKALEYHQGDRFNLAKKKYLEVLTDDPNDYKSLFNLGVLDMELGNYRDAAERLQQAFDIGIETEVLMGYLPDFVPDPEPLLAAYAETGQGRRASDVRSRYNARQGLVEDRMEAVEQEKASVADAAAAPEQDEVEETEEQPSENEECMKKFTASKIAFVAEGMDFDTVRDVICEPKNIRQKEGKVYWYYDSGTVVFESGVVATTADEPLEP